MKINIGGLSFDLGKVALSLAATHAPGMLQGAMIQWLGKYSAKEIYDMAMSHKDENLWQHIPEDWQETIAMAHSKSGVLDKVSVEWLVNALKDSRPDLSSLILNSKEVRAFLKKQLAYIKKQAEKFEAD